MSGAWTKKRMAAILAISVLLSAAVLSGPTAAHGPDLVPPSTGVDQGGEENETNITDPMLEIGRLVRISTNWGDMVIGMYEVGAPITSSNFLNLTMSGFYNGILFHRIIDDFVIQTGDPNTRDNNPYNDGWGGSAETIPLEVSPNVTHVDGAVGMARSSDPDSASSQFYICDTPQHGLDGNYAVFAVIVEGMETVRKIALAETYGNTRPLLKDHPVDDIIMSSVSVMNTPKEKDEDRTVGLFPDSGGISAGLGAFFLLGLVLIVLVVVVFVVRKVVRRIRRGRGLEIFDAEIIEEGETDGEKKEGRFEKGWGKAWREEKDWYED